MKQFLLMLSLAFITNDRFSCPGDNKRSTSSMLQAKTNLIFKMDITPVSTVNPKGGFPLPRKFYVGYARVFDWPYVHK